MPSPDDLANSVRRLVNKAAAFSREDKDSEAAAMYLDAAGQALMMGWLHSDDGVFKQQLNVVMADLQKLRDKAKASV